MAEDSSRGWSRQFTCWLGANSIGREEKKKRSGRHRRRKLRIEMLEDRRVLATATDLAQITGLVFDDFTGNGFNDGEQVAGATVNLYRDDGDGIFEPGTGDTLVQPATTAANGRYQFNSLTAGGYFVQQPPQTIAGRTLQQSVSPRINISATDVQGRLVTTIDPFEATKQQVLDDTADGVPVTSSIAAPEVIGRERDLLVNKTSTNGAVQLSVNDPQLPGVLAFDSIRTGQGDRVVSWDGVDNNAVVINDTGLSATDLTSNGTASGFQLQIGADLAGGQATVRVYTDDGNAATATRFSSTSLPIPVTGGTTSTSREYIPFTAFTAAAGGAADFTKVGAIVLEITGQANVNGSAELVGVLGSTIFTQDFNNFETADLSIVKTVNNARPTTNSNVTFTVTVSNSGPNAATGVVVTDLLPVGMTFVSSLPSQGTYNNTTGVWTVGTIANAGNASLQLVATVSSPGAKTNSAQITSSEQFDPDSTPNNNLATEDDQSSVQIVPEQIDLSLAKSVDRATPNTGDAVTYIVTVSNAGPDNATGVVITDQLPTGVAFRSATPSQGTYNSATGVWSVGAVANRATATLTLVGNVTGSGSVTNTAQITAADQTDVDSTPNNNVASEDDQATVNFATQSADLSLTKMVTNIAPRLGENVTFKITVSNAGPNAASGVRVADTLPTGLSFVSATVTQGTFTNGIWDVGGITISGNAALDLVARIDTAGAKTNVAQITAADQRDPDSTPNNNLAEDDQAAVTVTPAVADLSLTKTVDITTPNVGQNVTFTVTLNNAGPNPATGVNVRDQLPANTTFVSATPSQGTYDNASGVWTVGAIANAANATLRIVATAGSTGIKTNTAEVIASDQSDPDSTPGNGIATEDDQATASVTPEQIDLSVTKTVDNARPNRGENVRFTITLNNAGPSNATGVVLADRLGSGLTLVSATPSQGSFNSTSRVWTAGTINTAANATLQIVARVDRNGMLDNVAEVTAANQADVDSTVNNNNAAEDDQASVTLTTPTADLSLAKTVDANNPNIGDTVTFMLTVANAGPDNATGVQVTDLLPAGTTFVATTLSQGTFAAATGIWTVGDLNANQNATLGIVARVTTNGRKLNVAQVTAVNQFDPDSTPNNNIATEDDQASIEVIPQVADLSLTKTVDQARPNVGDSVTFQITLANSGPNAASGVQVLDILPVGLTFVSAVAQQGTYDGVSGIWNVGGVPQASQVTLNVVARVDSLGAKTNSAEVSASNQFDSDSIPGNAAPGEDDRASVSVTPAAADLSLTKTASSNTPNVGQEVTFTITVSNAGPDSATGVTVKDALPTNITFVSATPAQGTYDSTTGVWVVGTIATNSSAVLRIVGRPETVGDKINSAEILTSDRRDPDSTPGNGLATEDDQASITIAPQQVDLSLTKTVDNASPNVNDNITFTLTVSNAGPSAASGVVVTDRLPTGVTFVSSVTSQGSYNSATGQWNVGNIAVGVMPTLRIAAKVNRNGTLTNAAEITAAAQPDLDSIPNNNIPAEDDFASVDFTTQTADLSLTKSVDNATPLAKGTINFMITVSNTGPNDATGVIVRDALPNGLAFVSSSGDGTYDATSGRWTIGKVATGSSARLNLAVKAISPGTKTNLAEVFAANQFDPDSTPNNQAAGEDDTATVDVTPQLIDLSVKSVVDNEMPLIGETVAFTYTVSNAGPSVATGVQLRNKIPDGLSFVSANPSRGNFDQATGIWSIDSLGVGESASLQVSVKVNTFGFKRDRIEVVAADQIDVDSIPANGVVSEDDLAELVLKAPRILNKRLFLAR